MPAQKQPYLILRLGPCDGMRVPRPTLEERGTGVAVKLLDGGYALYDIGHKGGYYYSETVSEAEVERAHLRRPKRAWRRFTGASK